MKLTETAVFACRAVGTVLLIAGGAAGGWLVCQRYHAPAWALLLALLPVGVGCFLFALGIAATPVPDVRKPQSWW